MKQWTLMTCGVAATLATALTFVGCPPTGGDDDATSPPGASFTALYDGYFQNCIGCHTPSAPGRTDGTETTLDFTDSSTAENTLRTGQATGLTGNQTACNGVYFVGTSPVSSLIMAVLDEGIRADFTDDTHPDCNADTITDMALKSGAAPDQAFLDSLEAWINEQNSAVAKQDE